MLLTVALLSGKDVVVEADDAWTIHELKQRAQVKLGLSLLVAQWYPFPFFRFKVPLESSHREP